MSKHDQETQRILTSVPAPNTKSSLETQKISVVAKREGDRPASRATQETQRISTPEGPNTTTCHLSPKQLSGLTFGTLKLDTEGRVTRFNPFSNPSGPVAAEIQNKSFFKELTPFEEVAAFEERYLAAVKCRELYAEFKFHVTCEGSKPIDVQVTLYYSKTADSFWALVNRGAAEK